MSDIILEHIIDIFMAAIHSLLPYTAIIVLVGLIIFLTNLAVALFIMGIHRGIEYLIDEVFN